MGWQFRSPCRCKVGSGFANGLDVNRPEALAFLSLVIKGTIILFGIQSLDKLSCHS